MKSMIMLMLIVAKVVMLNSFVAVAEASTCSADGQCLLDRELAYNLYLAGNEFYTSGEIESAVDKYNEALRYDPQHSDTLCNLGSALQDLADYEGSLDAYSRAVEANPYHAVAHFNLGLLLHDEMVEVAIEHYQAAVESDPTMADSWSNLGTAFHGEGLYEEAVECYEEAIGLYEKEDPEYKLYGAYLGGLYYHMGQALSTLPEDECEDGPCPQLAIQALRKSLTLDPENHLAHHILHTLLEDSDIVSASPAYVQRLFDDYAATFDESLNALGYRAPAILRKALGEIKTHYSEVFDAGCGTGLCGPLFRDIAGTLVGVDLSPKMIEVARQRSVYDTLIVGEVSEQLKLRRKAGNQGDLVLAADVLVYFGDLSTIMTSAAEYLKPSGLMAFTCEQLEPFYSDDQEGEEKQEEGRRVEGENGSSGSDSRHDVESSYGGGEEDEEQRQEKYGGRGWKLMSSGRFAHSKAYVNTVAEQAGMQMAYHGVVYPRMEGGRPVMAHLFILQKK